MAAKSVLKHSLQLTPLAACLALALTGGALATDNSTSVMHARHVAMSQAPRILALRALQAPHVVYPGTSATLPVSSCVDDGVTAGSLRVVLAAAGDGDTIDLSKSGCSTITLSMGELVVNQAGLILTGPRPTATGPALTLDANHLSRVFHSTNSNGTLEIDNLAITNGNYHLDDTDGPFANGGCIYAVNSVSMSNSSVTNCAASGEYGIGGGIASFGAITLTNSSVSGNSVTATSTAAGTETKVGAFGGGTYSYGAVTLTNSTISENSVLVGTIGNAAKTGYLEGGGILISYFPGQKGNPQASTIAGSTISGNYSYGYGGGITANGNLTISNSTISGNSAVLAGGVNAYRAGLTLQNSTVAFNTAFAAVGGIYAPGATYISGNGLLSINSSIISNNSAGDTSMHSADLGAYETIASSGSDNLITSSDASVTFTTPPLTADPLLQPLGDNGGPTQTHALDPTSPAIGTGNNTAGLLYDQRGVGFPRSTAGLTNIGAVQVGDQIFANGFE